MSINQSRSFGPRDTKTPEANSLDPNDALQQKLDAVKLDDNIRLPPLPGGQDRGGRGDDKGREFFEKFLRDLMPDLPGVSPIEGTNKAIEEFKRQRPKQQVKPQLGGPEDLRLARTVLGSSADNDGD